MRPMERNTFMVLYFERERKFRVSRHDSSWTFDASTADEAIGFAWHEHATSDDVWATWYSQASATELSRGWKGRVYHSDGSATPVEEDLSVWDPGIPLVGIVQILNAFGAEGWSVVDWSEDKGVYDGKDASHESWPTRVRIVMSRSDSEASAS